MFALTLPPTTPPWMVAVGITFGVVLGKGARPAGRANVMNPALVARAFLFFAYPVAMSGDACWVAVQNTDAFTGATGLATVADATQGMPALEAKPGLWWMLIGKIPGSRRDLDAAEACSAFVRRHQDRLVAHDGWSRGGHRRHETLLLNAVGSEKNTMFAATSQWHLQLGGWASRHGVHGHRPRVVGLHRHRQARLRLLHRGHGDPGARHQPRLPRGQMLAILFMNMFALLIDSLRGPGQHQAPQRAVQRRSPR